MTTTAPEAPARGRVLTPVIDVREVTKTYGSGETAVHALRGVSFQVDAGDYIAIMGASGSGKSTLMHIVGCLDVPTTGSYRLSGFDVSRLDDRQLSLIRNHKIGFVFQAFNLIPRMTALANVELPLVYAHIPAQVRRRRALAALAAVGLSDRVEHEPNKLSGGQQQRVAVARALVTAPALLLADEPTGNLDSHATEEILSVLDRLNEAGRTIMLITHEHDVAVHAKRLIRLRDGAIIEDRRLTPLDGIPPGLGHRSGAPAVADASAAHSDGRAGEAPTEDRTAGAPNHTETRA